MAKYRINLSFNVAMCLMICGLAGQAGIARAAVDWSLNIQGTVGTAISTVTLGGNQNSLDVYDPVYDGFYTADTWAIPAIKAYFEHPDWTPTETLYRSDIRSLVAPQQWQLTVNSTATSQMLSLSWDVGAFPPGLKFTLTDASQSIDMRAQSSYSYVVPDTSDRILTISTSTNIAPVATADSYSMEQDVTLSVPASGVLANDTDAEGDPLTAVLVSEVSNGTLSLNGNGAFSYTPVSGFSGTDSFTYTVNDGTDEATSAATVSIHVNAVNEAPVANDDNYSMAQDGSVSASAGSGVLANDSDAEGDPLTAVLVSEVSNGTLSLNGNGAFSYTPTSGFSGTDSFSYTVNDGTDDAASAAVVTITVSSTTNNAPVPEVINTSLLTSASGGPSIPPENTLHLLQDSIGTMVVDPNDPDVGDTHSFSISVPANGMADVDASGNVSYTPTAGYFGTDSFEITVTDNHGASGTATVAVTVLSTSNTVPVLSAANISVREGSTGTTTISVTDPDVGDSHSFSISVQPTHGTATVDGNGVVSYTSNNGYTGSDSFEVSAKDSGLAEASVTVNVDITESWFSRVFGCTMSSAGSNTIDPTLPLLLFFSSLYLLRRRV